MPFDIHQASQEVLSRINKDLHLRNFVDQSLPIPSVFKGSGKIKLIVVGQDPTVESPEGRKSLSVVLNLDRDQTIRHYLTEICMGLQIELDSNVYATNFYKNYFVEPSAEMQKADVLEDFTDYWLPLLKREIDQFPSAPVITIGEPILKPLMHIGHEPEVRHYWGYSVDWRDGQRQEFRHIRPEANHLARHIFPFPHQGTTSKDFYRHQLRDYVSYIRSTAIE